MSSSNSPCAACKLLRRKCTQECVFAPYFPSDNPQRFACVHRVFGASNVAKLLNELSVAQRDDAVKSLAYEAEARLRDPVYGCIGFISLLQQRLHQIQTELHNAKKELSTYVSPQTMQILLANPGMLPSAAVLTPHLHHQNGFDNCGVAPQVVVRHGSGHMIIHDPQQQDFLEAQQMHRIQQQQQQQHVMLRNYEQQPEYMKFNGGLEHNGSAFENQVDQLLSPSLALGGFENVESYPLQQQGEHQHHPIEAQLLLSPQQHSQSHEHPHQQPSESEDARSIIPV